MGIKSIVFLLVMFISFNSITSNCNSEGFTNFIVDDLNAFLTSITVKSEPSLVVYDCANIAIAVYMATALNYKNDIESNKNLWYAVFGWLFFTDYLKNQYKKQNTSISKSILLTGLIMKAKSTFF